MNYKRNGEKLGQSKKRSYRYYRNAVASSCYPSQ